MDIQTNTKSVTMQSLDLRHLLEEFQCNLALIAALACRDGGIKTLLRVCHEKDETFSLGHCVLAGGPDLTVLVELVYYCCTYWPQDRRAQWVPSQGFKLSWEWKSCTCLSPHLQGFETTYLLGIFLPRYVWLPTCEQIWKGLGSHRFWQITGVEFSWWVELFPEAEKAPPTTADVQGSMSFHLCP